MIETAEGNALPANEAEFFSTCGALFLLAKPGIIAAITLSGFTGMVLAARGLPDAEAAVPCLASLLLMAAGSALVNSVLDRKLDRQMERLSRRSAALRRVGAGTALAAALALTAAAVTVSSTLLTPGAGLLLIAAAFSYSLYYTLFLKRHTHWAALLGALPGALPVLIGHAALVPRLDWSGFSFFLVMLVWQPPHFWLLSLSHREEYRAAGIPILPVVRGERFSKICIYLGLVALIPATLLLGVTADCSAGYLICASLLGFSYLVFCHRSMVRRRYRAAFRASILYILLLFAIIIADLAL